MSRYSAARVPVHQGPAAWNDILGAQDAAVPLSGETTADFVIVGAGFAGLSAARRLKQLHPDARVVVLEAGRVAEGAAGRNSGFMIDLPHELTSDNYAGTDDAALIALNRRAIAFGQAAVEDYDIPRDYFDPAGKINGAVGDAAEAHNTTYAAHLEALGEPCEMLDATQMAEITGSAYYRSGLYTKGTVMLQPAGYVRGLAAGLRQQGVEIFEISPVTAFERTGPDWRVTTSGGAVTTPRVILTVNGHLESFGVEAGRLMQVFLFASMTEELDAGALGGDPRWGVTPSDPMGTTMRRIDAGQGGNRIITRTCAKMCPDMQASAADVKRAARVQRQKFDARFPALDRVKMQYAWAGHLCLSLNGVSVMREIDDGVFSGCVQNGLGTARGTLTGIGAAELACGATSDITAHFAEGARPKTLPPQPFARIGANAVMRWKEWRARDE